MHKIRFVQKPNTAKDKRMEKAMKKYYMRNVAEVSKDRAVMYADAAAGIALYELYGFSSIRISRVFEQARRVWNEFDNRSQMIDAVKDYVDIRQICGFDFSKCDFSGYGRIAVKNFSEASEDAQAEFSAVLIALWREWGFGVKRLNAVMNHMWKAWLESMQDSRSIMQIYYDRTGIPLCMEESDQMARKALAIGSQTVGAGWYEKET